MTKFETLTDKLAKFWSSANEREKKSTVAIAQILGALASILHRVAKASG